MVAYSCDIAVIGGGISGVCAAIAAARCGRSVVLAGDRPVLGGNSSSEVRMWTRGATGGGSLYSEEMGILGELKLRNRQVNEDGNVLFWCETLLEAVYAEPGIRLLLNAHVTSVECRFGEILAVGGFQMGNEKEFTIRAKYYIDCTGDGSVAAKAGVPFAVGKGAPDPGSAGPGADADVMGSSILFFTRAEDHPVRFVPPAYAYDMAHVQGLLDRGGRVIDERQTGSDYWWFEYGGVKDTIRDSEDITFELKRLVMGVWNYVKNSGRYEAGNLTLEWIGNFAGKRESRRMIADYTLTGEDILGVRNFPDGAFYGGWFMDFHPAEGLYAAEENCTQIPVRSYPIPLRVLFNRDFPNLLFAGRIIGTSHEAFASTRIMDTCALSGQAAGTLAALSAESGMTPSERANSPGPVLQRLLRDDMLVIGLKNQDEADAARLACISASSYQDCAENQIEGYMPLDKDVWVQLAVPARCEQAHLLARGEIGARISGTIYAAPLPSALNPGERVGEIETELGADGRVLIALPECESNRFLTLALKACEGVALSRARRAPLGFLMGYRASAERTYPAIEIPYQDMYAGTQLKNGFNRAYGEPGLWVSGREAAPEILLRWERPQTVSQVILYLEPDLSQELPSSFAARWNDSHRLARPRPGRPWQLVKEAELWAQTERGWSLIARVRDNWQRRVAIDLARPIITQALKIAFPAGADDARAQVFEVRVYP